MCVAKVAETHGADAGAGNEDSSSGSEDDDDVEARELENYQERSKLALIALNMGTNLGAAIRERCQVMGREVPPPIDEDNMAGILEYARACCCLQKSNR